MYVFISKQYRNKIDTEKFNFYDILKDSSDFVLLK